MSQLVIQGTQKLEGVLPVYGSKNAALALLLAGLLTDEVVTIANIPAIRDVQKVLDIMQALGVTVTRAEQTVTIEARNVNVGALPAELVGQLRGSILLLGSLLGRERRVRLPEPGGDIIGARPVTSHLDGLAQLGATVSQREGVIEIDGAAMHAGDVTLPEFSVTATENLMMAAASLPGTTRIHIAAAEPHVVALAKLLTRMGARVEGAGTHTVTVHGRTKLGGAQFTNIPDMIEAGSFILLAAATQSKLSIRSVPAEDLRLFFKKIDEIGVRYTKTGDTVTVQPSALKAFRLQTMPHPGIATDLQAPFSVVATQAVGESLIHDPLYEGRLRHIGELQKMGARATICDPHRVVITGPTPLSGGNIHSLDIRAGMTLLMAGLVAEGKTTIAESEIIDRGYARIVERLAAVGAAIERIG